MQVDRILDAKGRDVATVAPDATVADAVAALAEHNVGALVVSNDGKTVEGIVSERDIVLALGHHGAGTLSLEVTQVMTRQVRTCRPLGGLLMSMVLAAAVRRQA